MWSDTLNIFNKDKEALCEVRVLSYKALGSVVHDAELKSLLVLEGFGESAAKSVGR